MGKVTKKLTTLGLAGAAGGVLFLTPAGNNLAKEIFMGDDAITIDDALSQEMTAAANGQGFNAERFITEKNAYTDIAEARGDLLYNTGILQDQRLIAAAECGWVAVNGTDIAPQALKSWQALESNNVIDPPEAYKAVGQLCLNQFPAINAPGTPEDKLAEANIAIITGVHQ